VEHALGHAGGVGILAVVGLVGAALIGYARAGLMHQALSTAFYIFVFVVGICLTAFALFSAVAQIYSKIQQSQKPSLAAQEPMAPPQRLSFRIISGFVGPFPGLPNALAILLDVKVTGADAKVAAWRLNLFQGDQRWYSPAQVKYPSSPFLYVLEPPTTKGAKPNIAPEKHEASPIPPDVPDRGHLLFILHDAGELFDQIFGATFELFAVEHDNTESFCRRGPEAMLWLRRVLFSHD
jgi:hypothetical protein